MEAFRLPENASSRVKQRARNRDFSTLKEPCGFSLDEKRTLVLGFRALYRYELIKYNYHY